MLNILKGRKEREEREEREERKLKAEQEIQLKQTLAQKCADQGGQYSSHKEDETQYTILTINGKTLKVKKEEITIESNAV